jgi:hypothetical protein
VRSNVHQAAAGTQVPANRYSARNQPRFGSSDSEKPTYARASATANARNAWRAGSRRSSTNAPTDSPTASTATMK